MKRTALFILATLVCTMRSPATETPLPYRFLLVINDQWEDPSSELIQNPGEFSILCALLRSWGLPFDIYRLDQQRFDAYHLLDRSGQPLHGTILWNAPRASLDAASSDLLRSLVKERGVGLIAFSDTVKTPVIAELAGIEPVGEFASEAPLAAARDHFIVRDVQLNPVPPPRSKLTRGGWVWPPASHGTGMDVKLSAATALVMRDGHAMLTARGAGSAGRTVWLDAERASSQIFRQDLRDLLKRAIVWVNGFALYAEYPRSVVLGMDDMGSSDKTYYAPWHYPTLSEETIRARIIAPLQKHGARMTQLVNTGWLDRANRRVLNPWEQSRVVDELDRSVVHDFASTKRGLEAGLRAGVFDLDSHGWTHMLPDLDSEPGPFWGAPADGGIVQLNWYKEFGDVVRKKEIPSAVQRVHLQRSIDGLREDFGVVPVALRCGGGQSSASWANNTMRLATKMGFRIAHAEHYYYLGLDYALALDPVSPSLAWNYTERLPAAAVPWTIDAPVWIGSHDRDVAMNPDSFAQLLEDLGGANVRFLTYAEYAAYLHAEVDRAPSGGGALAFRVRYAAPGCGFFKDHASRWTLHVADETRGALKLAAEKRVVVVPPASGSHVIRAE